MIQIGMLVNERYEILEKIGTGGMSVVYKARCTVLERYVAIKVLREEYCLDDEFVRRFKVEAQSAASLSHDNIVQIYDVGNDGKIHFIVMEYLKGITLKEYIARNGFLDESEVMKISALVASALEHAHENKIIHRDIKPQNIMITDDGGVKVMDFGIARMASDATIVATEMTVGSVHYIAPEQARGTHSDEKNDIYSLGITMYEMVTGDVPFNADSAVTVALKHINDDLPAINQAGEVPRVSKGLETIIIKATKKRVQERYQSAEELLKDLKKAANFPNMEFVNVTPRNEENPTIVITEEEQKHINKYAVDYEEEEEYEKEKKGGILDALIVILGIVSAFVLVGVIGIFVFRYVDREVLPHEVTVPVVEGMAQESADMIFKGEEEIDYKIIDEQYNDTVAKGHIISQSLEGLVTVNPDETVTVELVISKGIELFKVPNVLNLEYNQAKLTIKNIDHAELDFEMITEHHETALIGQVFKQTPAAGEEVKKGTKVTFYVSSGKEKVMVTMPEVKNLSESDASKRIEEAGLKVGNITTITNDEVRKGNVITANVEAGTEIAEDYVVNLVVSDGKASVTKPVTITDILPLSQNKGLVQVYFEDEEGNERVVYENEVTKDEFPIVFNIEGRDYGILKVYLDGTREYANTITFDKE